MDKVILADSFIDPGGQGESMGSRTLSARESDVILSLEAEDRDEVTITDIAERASVSRSYARKLAHDLHQKRWLQRIGRGRYLRIPAKNGPEAIPETNPFRLGSHLVDPYYFAYGTAANFHGLVTQAPRTYMLATTVDTERELREPIAFRIVTTVPRKFFGWEETERYGETVKVTDLDKTLLDCLDRQDLAGGLPGVVQAISQAKPRIDADRLGRYVKRFETGSLAQRLGYLLERVRPQVEVDKALIETLRSHQTSSYVHLGSPARYGTQGDHDSEWKVIVNVPEEEMFGEVTVR